MPESTRKPVALLVAAAVVAALAVGLAFLLRETERSPSGPAEVIWDRDVCAHCRMHVGEPAFAAQLQTADGQVLHFDDPGCFFELVDEQEPALLVAWFHHVRDDRWLPAEQTGFVRVDRSPMGYGLGAVEAGPGAELTFEQARAAVLQHGALSENGRH